MKGLIPGGIYTLPGKDYQNKYFVFIEYSNDHHGNIFFEFENFENSSISICNSIQDFINNTSNGSRLWRHKIADPNFIYDGFIGVVNKETFEILNKN